jgi:hypothetical protein
MGLFFHQCLPLGVHLDCQLDEADEDIGQLVDLLERLPVVVHDKECLPSPQDAAYEDENNYDCHQ